ncbi:hypothetical protein J0J80_10395 [Turicibacter bilis]|uniref:hypothetical protein n=1 Tax=Turicibacter bilis TaxID=2735723 RepID=UPI001BAF73B0|nr:hypothetical protein [Turicibacter bilis]MBS3201993.1 hypothetical protein [Turicibacter bilis]UUF10427.1 hypothetical protein J0J80_10395 [Turicibacter bilis]
MADAVLIPAVAGAGKTYHISHSIIEEKRNLILSFTRSNVKNIEIEITKRFGKIPEKTEILTFSSFLYRWLIRPYEPSIILEGKDDKFKSKGVDVYIEPIERQGNGYTPGYYKDNHLLHYINGKNQSYYASRMSELIVKQKGKFIGKVIGNLSMFFDEIYIDEIQDFRGNDFKLLKHLFAKFNGNIIGVGDFYQHSVQKSNHKEQTPFLKSKKSISYQEYLQEFPKKVKINNGILLNSRRVPEIICQEIRQKLNIEIYSSSSIQGSYTVIHSKEELQNVIKIPNLIGLIYNNNVKNYFIHTNTWSMCKGDTYESTCIVLTEKLKAFTSPDFNTAGISQQTINMLYVALTRATHNVYIVPKEIYDLLK